MKATEFRIGNLCQDKMNTKNFFPVIAITNINIMFDYEVKCGIEWQAEPIPLTEELLVKFGFEKAIIDCYVKRTDKNSNWNQLTFEFDDDILYFTGGEGWLMSRPLEYVHDIQNFWHSLTGEELTITDHESK